MNPALGARVRQLEAEAYYRRSVTGFRNHRRADEQARIGALLSEVIAVLAEALEVEDRCDRCARCLRALSPRRRTCQRCGAPVEALAEQHERRAA
jgi:hypothetical protein